MSKKYHPGISESTYRHCQKLRLLEKSNLSMSAFIEAKLVEATMKDKINLVIQRFGRSLKNRDEELEEESFMDEDELVARIRAELNDFIETEVDRRIAVRFQNWDQHMQDCISRYVSETWNAYIDKVAARNKLKAKKIFDSFLEDY